MKPAKTRDGLLRGGRAALIRLLILAAVGISAYLLSVSLSGGQALGCGIGSGCDEVLQSRWAYVLGIPVSALALVVDLTLLLTSFACGAKSSPKQRRSAWEILVPCSVLVLGAALWFVALQAIALHRFCPWCMTAHVCGALAAILLLMRVPVTDATERREKDPAVARPMVLKLALAAVIGVALLGVAQTAAPRKTYSVANVPVAVSPAPTNTTPAAVPKMPTNIPVVAAQAQTNTKPNAVVTPAPVQTNVASAATAPPPGSPMSLDLYGGRIRLDLAQAPVWGSPTAPVKMVSLFDYSCHHCREMHPVVLEVQKMFSNKLAIVSLPMPLDASCNPLIPRTPRAHTNACAYAKLGLTVWRAKRAAIQPFDDWLFGFQNPPPLVDVTNKAIELVGQMPFDVASRDPWIEQQLRIDTDLFTISVKEYNKVNMPQFMIGTNVVEGNPTAAQLAAVIAPYVDAAK